MGRTVLGMEMAIAIEAWSAIRRKQKYLEAIYEGYLFTRFTASGPRSKTNPSGPLETGSHRFQIAHTVTYRTDRFESTFYKNAASKGAQVIQR